MWTAGNRKDYERKGLRYPSDQTDGEWALARRFVCGGKYATSEWETRLRAVLDGVLYVLTTGCQLPEDFPPRSTVHAWFVRWHCDGVLDRLHFALYVQARELAGKEASPTAAIVDSQSVKNAEKGVALTRTATTRPRRSRARSATPLSTLWARCSPSRSRRPMSRIAMACCRC
jgi:transposase